MEISGIWVDMNGTMIHVYQCGEALRVCYGNGRGPFEGMAGGPPGTLIFDASDSPGDRLQAGVLEDEGASIRWANGTAWVRVPEEADPDRRLHRSFAWLERLGLDDGSPAFIAWIERSAALGCVEALYRLGALMLAENDPLLASIGLARLEGAGAQGHVQARHAAGVAHRFGLGTTVDAREAERWFRLAAEQGHAESQLALAQLLLASTPPPEAEASGEANPHAVPHHGDRAQVQGGDRAPVHDGDGIQAQDEALQWLRMAAERGNPEACFELGRAHLTGRGIERDEGQALDWFRLAASQHPSGGR